MDIARKLHRLEPHIAATIGIIIRVQQARRHEGGLCFFHVLLTSHVHYAASMHKWLAAEWEGLNVPIRKTVTRVLGQPIRTSTEGLLALGTRNTLDEIIEAQRTAQISRLSVTQAGWDILVRAGISTILEQERIISLLRC